MIKLADIPNAPQGLGANPRDVPLLGAGEVRQAFGSAARGLQRDTMSLDAFSGEGKGLAALGQGITTVGQAAAAMAEKVLDAQIETQTFRAESAAAASWAEFAAEAPRMAPEQIGTAWQERLKRTKETLLADRGLSPVARQRIGNYVERWGARTSIEAGAIAAQATFREAESGIRIGLENDIETGNEASFNARLRKGIEGRYLYPEQEEAYKLKFARAAEYRTKKAQADLERTRYEGEAGLAIQNPQAWKANNPVNSPMWEGKEIEWQRIKNIADARENEGTAEAAESLVNGIYTGEIKTPAEVDAIDNPFLTPVLRQKAKEDLAKIRRVNFDEVIKAPFEGAGLTVGVRNAVAIRQEILGLDPESDADRVKQLELMSAIRNNTPAEYHETLVAELRKRYQLPQIEVRDEIKKSVGQVLDVQFDPFAGVVKYKSRVPLIIDGKQAKNYDGTVKMHVVEDREAKLRAIDVRTRVEMQLNDWMQANPKDAADPAKVRAQINKALPAGVRAVAFGQLSASAQASSLLDEPTVAAVKAAQPKLTGERLAEVATAHARNIDDALKRVGGNVTPEQRKELLLLDIELGGKMSEIIYSSGGSMAEIRRQAEIERRRGKSRAKSDLSPALPTLQMDDTLPVPDGDLFTE